MKKLALTTIAVSLLIVASVGTATAQTILGSIAGVITDPRGDSVQGATVTIKNEATGLTRELTTNETGFYRADSLPIGENYSITVQYAGFRKEIRQQVAVRAVAITRVDIQLAVGDITEIVEVTAAGAEVLDRTEARVAKSIETRQVFELPGRNTLTGLALLVPGKFLTCRVCLAPALPPAGAVLGPTTSTSMGPTTTMTRSPSHGRRSPPKPLPNFKS